MIRMIRLASRLDRLGHHDLADKVDRVARYASQIEDLGAEAFRLRLEEGLDNQTAADMMHLPVRQFRRMFHQYLSLHPELREHPAFKPRLNRQQRADQAVKALELFEQGLNLDQVGQRLEPKTTGKNVSKMLLNSLPPEYADRRQTMIGKRPASGGHAFGEQMSSPTMQAIGELWLEGKTAPEIQQVLSEEYGITLSTGRINDYVQTYRGMKQHLFKPAPQSPPPQTPSGLTQPTRQQRPKRPPTPEQAVIQAFRSGVSSIDQVVDQTGLDEQTLINDVFPKIWATHPSLIARYGNLDWNIATLSETIGMLADAGIPDDRISSYLGVQTEQFADLMKLYRANHPAPKKNYRRTRDPKVSTPPEATVGDLADQAAHRFLQGEPIQEIARTSGIYPDAVRMMVQMFWARHPEEDDLARRFNFDWNRFEQVGKMVDGGMTVEDVANAIGRKRQLVSQMYQVYKQRVHGPSPVSFRTQQSRENIAPKMLEEYLAGKPAKDIARDHNINSGEMQTIFYRHLSPEDLMRYIASQPNLNGRMSVPDRAMQMGALLDSGVTLDDAARQVMVNMDRARLYQKLYQKLRQVGYQPSNDGTNTPLDDTPATVPPPV